MSLAKLKKFTQARIGLGQSGIAPKTRELLKLKEDLAKAQDAVKSVWHWQELEKKIEKLDYKTLVLKSRADSRENYLQRPDLGRLLCEKSENLINNNKINYDIAIIISDGLSPQAIDNHFLGFFNILASKLPRSNFTIGPICLVPFGRVAIGDQIGTRLKAQLTLMILGERPGLSAFDSLGIYLTYNPKLESCDADRNCISNIRPPEGLSYEQAINKLWYLITTSFKLKLSGVNLKERGEHKLLKPKFI